MLLELFQVHFLDAQFFFFQLAFLIQMSPLVFPLHPFFLDLVDHPLQVLYRGICYGHFFLRIKLTALDLLIFTTQGIQHPALFIQYFTFRTYLIVQLSQLFAEHFETLLFVGNLE